MLLKIFMYKFFCLSMLSFLCGIYLGVTLLGHKETLTFWEIDRLYYKVAAPFYISSNNVWGIKFLHILNLLLSFIISDNWWYLLMDIGS